MHRPPSSLQILNSHNKNGTIMQSVRHSQFPWSATMRQIFDMAGFHQNRMAMQESPLYACLDMYIQHTAKCYCCLSCTSYQYLGGSGGRYWGDPRVNFLLIFYHILENYPETKFVVQNASVVDSRKRKKEKINTSANINTNVVQNDIAQHSKQYRTT